MKKKLIWITTVPQSLGGLLQEQLKFMSQHFEVIKISSSGNGLLKEYAQSEGYKCIPVEMTRKITHVKDLCAIWLFYKILKKEKPYIVYSHTPKAGTLGMIATKLAGVPYRLHTIARIPLLEGTGLKRKLLNTVEKLTF